MSGCSHVRRVSHLTTDRRKRIRSGTSLSTGTSHVLIMSKRPVGTTFFPSSSFFARIVLIPVSGNHQVL